MDEKQAPTHFEHTHLTRWLVPVLIGILLVGLVAVIVLSLI